MKRYTTDPGADTSAIDVICDQTPTPIVSDVDELRKKITETKDRLAGRIATHRKVAKLSGWSVAELEQVIKEDGWIFEDEILALFTSYTHDRETEARIDTARHIDEHIIGSPRRATVNEKMADYITALKATRKDGV